MSERPDTGDELMQGLLEGTVDPEDPAVRERAERDPEFRRQWAEFRRLQHLLDAEQAAQERAWDEAQAQAPRADHERVRQSMDDRPALPRWLPWAAAAVLVAGLLLAWHPWTGPAAPPHGTLGPDDAPDAAAASPRGAVTRSALTGFDIGRELDLLEEAQVRIRVAGAHTMLLEKTLPLDRTDLDALESGVDYEWSFRVGNLQSTSPYSAWIPFRIDE